MPPVTVLGGALSGVDAIPIEVEVDLLARLPAVSIVGLAASAVKESAERVRSAIVAAEEEFPRKRVVVNLMPADVRKDGTALDLPVALGILAAQEQLPPEAVHGILAIGELSLSGALRPVRGALSMALLARELGRTLVLPQACAAAASLVPNAQVVGASNLGQIVRWLRGEAELPRVPHHRTLAPRCDLDLADVRGQHDARFALEVAAAGAHHMLMTGPPGCGKTMLAQRLPSILPPLTFEESLATTRIYAAAGLLDTSGGLLPERPFRAPHHSITTAGLAGDRTLRPGEVSLAHNGVLFLDEATEFPRSVLETLRAPLEDGAIRLARAQGTVSYPAAITLVLACNPCPCGMRGSGEACQCGDHEVYRYMRRLSGPILDRVDLHIELRPVTADQLLSTESGEPSADVRARVLDARERQRSRGQTVPNGQLHGSDVQRFARPGDTAGLLLRDGCQRYALSGRATTRLQKVARTLADLNGSDQVEERHITGALSLRRPRELQ